MLSLQNRVTIIDNQSLEQKGYYLLTLLCPSNFKEARPGQFVHIRINNNNEPLLRRPFSIHRVRKEPKAKGIFVKVLYEVVGKGTALLMQKKPRQEIDILGPNGKGFDYDNLDKNTIPIIVCGGMGVAPLLFLVDKIASSWSNSENKPVVLIGATTKKKILCENEFRKLGCPVYVATDDGSVGFNGRVTNLFKKELKKIYTQQKKLTKIKAINVFACGPMPMLCELAKISKIEKIPLQVSLEGFMGCGIGACLGCAIETNQGYRRVCHDGPVFYAQDIAWKF